MTAPLRPQSAEQEFPTVDWAIRAAEKIFSLYRDSNYFRSMPPKPLIAGWAKIILDNAPTQPFILSAAYARAAAPQARPDVVEVVKSSAPGTDLPEVWHVYMFGDLIRTATFSTREKATEHAELLRSVLNKFAAAPAAPLRPESK